MHIITIIIYCHSLAAVSHHYAYLFTLVSLYLVAYFCGCSVALCFQ